jgi:hypothetical protein
VGDIGVLKDWWNFVQDLLFSRILSDNPFPVDVDEPSEESYKEAYKLLSMAIKEFDMSKPATLTASIGMFRALLSSTDNQAQRLTTTYADCQSADNAHRTDWACDVTADTDATSVRTVFIDDCQKLSSSLIISCRCRYQHSDHESNLRLNPLILLKL